MCLLDLFFLCTSSFSSSQAIFSQLFFFAFFLLGSFIFWLQANVGAMRDLIALVESVQESKELHLDELRDVRVFAVDAEGMVYFVGKSPENTLYGFHPNEKSVSLTLPLEQDELLPPDAHVIGIEYIPDLEAVCLVSRSGEIILYQTENNEVWYTHAHTPHVTTCTEITATTLFRLNVLVLLTLVSEL